MSLVSTGTSFCLCSAGWGCSIPLTSPHFSCPMLIPAPALWLAGKGQSCCTQRRGLARVGDNHHAQGLCTHRVLWDSCQQQGRWLALVSAANRLSSGLRQAEQTHRHVQHQGPDEIALAPPPLPDAAPSAPAVPKDRSQDNFAAHKPTLGLSSTTSLECRVRSPSSVSSSGSSACTFYPQKCL